MAVDRALAQRAQVHAALGEPVRLAIVDELVLSDRSPVELAARFQLPSNLLAHHLRVLTEAGLVERLTSSGDRRRKYVRLRTHVLDEMAIQPIRRAPRMLFVCSHNSARSQLAAALWTARTGQPSSSAGTRPARRVHPGAVAAARRAGLDIGSAVPQPLREVDGAGQAAQVVTVCDRAHEELAPQPAAWHWSIADPVAIDTDEAFDATVHQLDDRITALTRHEEKPDD